MQTSIYVLDIQFPLYANKWIRMLFAYERRENYNQKHNIMIKMGHRGIKGSAMHSSYVTAVYS